jgi:hypothetical protein
MYKIAGFDKDKSSYLLVSIEKMTTEFLKNHPDEVFYSFAFDCNSLTGEINLSMNTEEELKDSFQTPEEFYSSKFSVGDWKYSCFDSDGISDEEFCKITQDLKENEWTLFSKKLLLFFTEILIEFSETECFKRIPKTDDFKILCIDHDEDLSLAELRMYDMLDMINSVAIKDRPLLADIFSGKKFGFGMGVLFTLAGLFLVGVNYYTINYHGFYRMKLMALNCIFLFLGPTLILFPGANIIKKKGENHDYTTILWWKESSKAHRTLWITMAMWGF